MDEKRRCRYPLTGRSMAELIIYHQGAYNLWDMAKPTPRFDHGLSRLQLEVLVEKEQGEIGKAFLPSRLQRAHAQGTSSNHGTPLEVCIALNRAALGGGFMPADEFMARYLSRSSRA